MKKIVLLAVLAATVSVVSAQTTNGRKDLAFMNKPSGRQLTEAEMRNMDSLAKWTNEEVFFTEIARRLNEFLLTEGFVEDSGRLVKDSAVYYRLWVTWREARDLWKVHGYVDFSYAPARVKTCGGDPIAKGRINYFSRCLCPGERLMRADIHYLPKLDSIPLGMLIADMGLTGCGNPGENEKPPRYIVVRPLPVCRCKIDTGKRDTTTHLVCTVVDRTWWVKTKVKVECRTYFEYFKYQSIKKDCDTIILKHHLVKRWWVPTRRYGIVLGGLVGLCWLEDRVWGWYGGDGDNSSSQNGQQQGGQGGPSNVPGQHKPGRPTEQPSVVPFFKDVQQTRDLIAYKKNLVVKETPQLKPTTYFGVAATFSLYTFGLNKISPLVFRTY